MSAIVTVHMVASVDGFIEAPDGDIAWFETVVTHRALPLVRPTVALYAGDLRALAERLAAKYRSIWVVGGAALVRDFFKQKLVQEIRLSILPVVLGGGLPFFDQRGAQVPLHLKKVTGYKTGIVELRYEVR